MLNRKYKQINMADVTLQETQSMGIHDILYGLQSIKVAQNSLDLPIFSILLQQAR